MKEDNGTWKEDEAETLSKDYRKTLLKFLEKALYMYELGSELDRIEIGFGEVGCGIKIYCHIASEFKKVQLGGDC